MQKFENICQNQANLGYFLQKLLLIKITQVLIFLTRIKLGGWNSSNGNSMISKNLWHRFLSFWFFFQIFPKFGQNVRFFWHNLPHLLEIKNLKFFFTLFRIHVEVPEDQISASFLRFWTLKVMVLCSEACLSLWLYVTP